MYTGFEVIIIAALNFILGGIIMLLIKQIEINKIITGYNEIITGYQESCKKYENIISQYEEAIRCRKEINKIDNKTINILNENIKKEKKKLEEKC